MSSTPPTSVPAAPATPCGRGRLQERPPGAGRLAAAARHRPCRLYGMHVRDGVTPLEEIVQTLGDRVRAGRIRHCAVSDMPAWVAAKAATIASVRGAPGPIAMEVESFLVAPGVTAERREPIQRRRHRSRLACPGRPPGGRRRAGTCPGRGRPGLAWTMARPGVASTIVGARTAAQPGGSLAAASLRRGEDRTDRLDAVGAPVPGLASGLAAPMVRRMISGGHDVAAWGEVRSARAPRPRDGAGGGPRPREGRSPRPPRTPPRPPGRPRPRRRPRGHG